MPHVDDLAELRRCCWDGRYSDEFIGNLTRSIFGRSKPADGPQHDVPPGGGTTDGGPEASSPRKGDGTDLPAHSEEAGFSASSGPPRDGAEHD